MPVVDVFVFCLLLFLSYFSSKNIGEIMKGDSSNSFRLRFKSSLTKWHRALPLVNACVPFLQGCFKATQERKLENV